MGAPPARPTEALTRFNSRRYPSTSVHQHTVMLLTRTSICYFATVSHSKPLPKDRFKTNFLRDAIKSCTTAATTSNELFEAVNNWGLLNRFSCQDPLFCTAALCVFLFGMKIEARGVQINKIIVEGILILQRLGRGSETASSSLETLIRGFQPFFP
ncbi:putative Transcription factor domain-containing protein [Seiridium cardinale]|uniref:Transcription factor domain-containing protein n=1 Tax=Seiridium cardinale TaxID=138064 RepID=A0ABR2XQM5_9PEZI